MIFFKTNLLAVIILDTTNGSQNIAIGNGSGSQVIVTNLNSVNSFSNITITTGSLGGAIAVNEPLTLNGDLTLQGSEIFINKPIRGNNNTSFYIFGDGTTTNLNANISVPNVINIFDNVILGNDVTLTSNSLIFLAQLTAIAI